MAALSVKVFSCSICNEPLGDTPFSTLCGHMFHYNCISQWLFRSGSETCPNCRTHVPRFSLLQLFPSEDDKFWVKTKEELELLQKKLKSVRMCNADYKNKMNNLTLKLNAAEENLDKSNKEFNDINTKYSNHCNNCVNLIAKVDKETLDCKYNQEKSTRILLQKECYEYHSIVSAELKELQSEIENLKSEKNYFQKKCHDLELSSTSSKILTRSISTLSRQIQSSAQPSPDGFLSNCHFWIVNELEKVSGATNHIHFNEQRVLEHGGTVAYHYTNMVTHVIGVSRKNSDVLRGLKERKKCATDYWLSDVISERKMIKPWLPHHFPMPYCEDNLPFANKEIAIVNFDKNEYIKIKVMAECLGAMVINKISRSTDMVITLKLEGGMIKKALALKLPVVNAQWITDVFLNEKIGLQDFKHKKYQQFDLCKSYLMDYNMVSSIMEAWEKHLNVSRLQFSTKKVCNKSTLANNKRKACVVQEVLESVDNDDDNDSITSVATTSTETKPHIKFSKKSIRQPKDMKKGNKNK